MKKEAENIDKPQGNALLHIVRAIIFLQATLLLFSSIVWVIKDDFDKWFIRWALGMLLLSTWGVMKQLSLINLKQK